MAEESKADKLAILMEENPDATRIGIYSIAISSLLIALRRVRPFTRFTRPSDIPKRFIKSRTKLQGTVERVEPTKSVLMVKHQPLFKLIQLRKDLLPVKISGITVNSNGLSWLQSIVLGNKITFIPVHKQKDCVQCEITMEQKTRENKVTTLHIGPTIVSVGFAKVDPIEQSLARNSFYKAYYKSLKQAEKVAEKKRLGKWYYVNITQDVSTKMARLFWTALLTLYKTIAKSKKPIAKPKLILNKVAST